MARTRNDTRIRDFMAFTAPLIVHCMKAELEELGCAVTQKGKELDAVLFISTYMVRAELHILDVVFNIIVVDGEQTPPAFDERILDFEFFCEKVDRVVERHLSFLKCFVAEKDLKAAAGKLQSDPTVCDKFGISKMAIGNDARNPHLN